MRFAKKGQKHTIIYNSKITVSNIPGKAYEYVVNDPNDWATEVGKPRYILDLLLSIINLSVQTVDIVEGLPKMDFQKVESL
jgi:predicted helicase